jgi:acyl-coenzyme A synthetase/AMP-(fatty) acid ligase
MNEYGIKSTLVSFQMIKMSDTKPRAVICVNDPWNYIPKLENDYSIMIINPTTTQSRLDYLLSRADWSLLVTSQGEQQRDGNKYANEKVLWYTSGTTGDSKFCSFSETQVDILAKKICDTYDITDNDRYASVMGLWHAHGQGFYWATRLAKCETNFLPISEIRSMPKFDPTFITAIPDVLKVMGDFKFNSLRFIRSASAPLSDDLYHNLKTKFNIPIIEAFGMTEALSHCFTNPLNGEQRVGTIGLPDGIETDIRDGHLYIKGPTLFTNDWYDTGDLADTDPAGYYRILGRSKDQINVRGIKLNPVSIEQQLKSSVIGVDDCVVFGKDKVKCIYVGSARTDDISAFLTGLGACCRPALIKSVDAIPLAPSGKVSRQYLESLC